MLRTVSTLSVVAVLLLCLCLCLPQGPAFSAATAKELPNVHPATIVAGSDGTLWFTEDRGIDQLTTAGKFHLFRVPPTGSSSDDTSPSSLAVDKTGQAWFTEGQRIGRIGLDGTLTLFPVAKKLGYPTVFGDPQRQIWRMLQVSTGDTTHASFARIAPSGEASPAFSLQAGDQLIGPVVGKDGRFWFTDTHITNATQGSGPSTARWVTADGHSARYPLPGIPGMCSPAECILANAMASGADGSMWYSYYGAEVGRVTSKGHVDVFPLSPIALLPTALVEGPDGNMWIGMGGYGIESISPTGKLAFYPVSGRLDIYTGITVGLDQALWFTSQCTNTVRRITPSGHLTSFHIPGTAADAGNSCPTLP